MPGSNSLYACMKCLLLAFAVAVGVTGCTSESDDSPCNECGPGTMCVQLLDGVCGGPWFIRCEPIVTGCEQPECSPACDEAYCNPGSSTCSAAPCPEDIPGAFQCYSS